MTKIAKEMIIVMYKDRFGRQHGFACPNGPRGPKGNYELNSDYKDFNNFGPNTYIYVLGYGYMTSEEYFKTYNKNILKRKNSEESLINLDPKDLEDNLTMGLIEWSEKQVLKDRLESEQAQLEARIKKLESFLTDRKKQMLKDKLEAEQEQLDAKIKKLEAFLTNKDKLKDIKFKQIQLLHKQLSGMKTYLEALTERIKNL